jgi:hypothetical protein
VVDHGEFDATVGQLDLKWIEEVGTEDQPAVGQKQLPADGSTGALCSVRYLRPDDMLSRLGGDAIQPPAPTCDIAITLLRPPAWRPGAYGGGLLKVRSTSPPDARRPPFAERTTGRRSRPAFVAARPSSRHHRQSRNARPAGVRNAGGWCPVARLALFE